MSTLVVTKNKIRTAFTFPRTRATLREIRSRTLLLWWLAAPLSLAVAASIRGWMDNVGLPVHGAGLETTVFGSLPTVWLQDHVYSAAPGAFSWMAAAIHVSWFVVPWLAALLVTWKRPRRIGSFFCWWIALHFIVNIFFALYPLRPPWVADVDVTRLTAVRLGAVSTDNNPLAAMPSLHVALPLLLSFWFFRERWTVPGTAMLAYVALIAFEVVFSGEHYVVDVIGAVVVASAIALAAKLDYRQVFSRLSGSRLRPPVASGTLALEPAPIGPAPLRRREHGQALVELALVLPLIFVFIMLMVDFGIALDRREVLQHSVREGARYGAVGASVSAIKQRVVDQSEGVLSLTDVSVCYSDGPDSNITVGDPGDNVHVSASFNYKFSVGSGELLTAWGAPVPSITMTPSADMRLENAASGATACP